MSLDDHSVLPTERINEALAGLDLSLESELALYRRSRSVAIELADPAIALPLDTPIDFMVRMDSPLSELAAEDGEAQAKEPLALKIEGDAKLESDLDQEVASRQPENTRAGDLIEKSQPLDATFSSVRTTRTDTGLMPFPSREGEDPEALPVPYGDEITAEPKAFERFLDPSIQDYLESSEALLKHLDEPSDVVAPSKKSPKPSKPSWVLPLKVVLGVLGVSALVWLSLFLLSQLFGPKSNPNIQPQPLSSQALPPQNSAVPSPSMVPTLPSPVSSGLPTVSSSPLLGASPSPQSALTPPVVSASPTSPTPVPSPVPSPTPSLDANAAYYLVVATENGPETLGQAQRVVKDAFAIDIDGQTRIQLGMVDTLPQAQALVNDFKNQGLAASILPQKN